MPLGLDTQRRESWEKVTGTAKYCDDAPPTGCLFAAPVVSRHAHARIRGIETDAALREPGVYTVVTGKDFPVRCGGMIADKPPLAMDKVRYCGEPVALVVAKDEYTARKAALSVKVTYELLPMVLSPAQALAPDAALVHDDMGSYIPAVKDVRPEPGTNIAHRVKIRKGSMEAAWAGCATIVEGTFHIGQTDHLAMETRSARAEILPDGRVIIHTSSQAPFAVRKELSSCFGLEEGLVEVHVPYLGGAFGGKVPAHLEMLAYMASKTMGGRMVRVVNTREEDIASAPCSLGLESTIKLGASPDGLLLAAEMTHLMDTGAYADIGPRLAAAIATDCCGPYHIPNLHCDVLCVYTNHTYATSYRGFGHMESAFGLEHVLDKLAGRMGIDPLELRIKNALQPGHYTPTQVKVTQSNMGSVTACMEKLRDSIRWQEGPLTDMGNGKVRAKGIGCVCKTSQSPTDAVSGVLVTMNSDGSLNLNMGAVEMGSGAKTTAAEMLAEAMRMSPERVYVNMDADTRLNPEHWKTVASMTTFMVGHSILNAAQDLTQQLIRHAAVAMKCSPEDVELGEERVYLRDDPSIYIAFRNLAHGFTHPDGPAVEGPIIGKGQYMMRHLTYMDPETGKGKPGPYWTVGAQAVEIEYDKASCTYRLLRAATVIDAGKVLNPKTARGLVMGGMAMGLGKATRETFHMDADGGIDNTSLRSYKLLHYGGQPEYAVDFVETPLITGPFGARGLAEHGIVGMPAAVANALSRAAGVDLDALPITPEFIWNRLGGEARDPL